MSVDNVIDNNRNHNHHRPISNDNDNDEAQPPKNKNYIHCPLKHMINFLKLSPNLLMIYNPFFEPFARVIVLILMIMKIRNNGWNNMANRTSHDCEQLDIESGKVKS